MENAVIVWPEGNENLSGGRTFDQQCGSNWQGRLRWLNLFNSLNTPTPTVAAIAAALTAAYLLGLRMQVPKHPRFFGRFLKMRGPLSAKQNFVHPMRRGDYRNQASEWRKC